ncbi:Putative STE/STE20/FRAY protein kinase [Rhizopus microsporus]|nr:Putative STE/STE20/FRAY protein kinase [Rhizopus microsporus]
MRVAIKMINLDLFERNQIDELRRETALMALCKHPNLLKVYGSFVNGSKLYIATPYLSGGSCLDIMKSGFRDGFEEMTIATILKQALEGLIYLHKNGHIHRDVKAGNLLMDDQGTVLLADFGVSSSLTENSEIRKTFVGTPCWMAPEVMEQSGYNFKADIWSFGITAIELATGHAPFAKFPPMKVLMMTLNQSPPTLNRDQTKYKYSRTFKEMIDYCLQKDPNKRPTAEKLIQHPFFKQAKKKDYLVKSVLACVPPLDERPHKRIAFKQTTIENSDQWDFDDTSPHEKSRHITFGNVMKNTDKAIGLPSPAPSEPEISSPSFHRRSRFVIDDYTHPSDTTTTATTTATTTTIGTSTGPHRSISPNQYTPQPDNSSPMSASPPQTCDSNSWQSSVGLGLGISHQQENGEIKKGRFSVNQASVPKPENLPFLATDPSQDIRPIPMSRALSNESTREGRKSRFEIQHLSSQSSGTTTLGTTPPYTQDIRTEPLTRESSSYHQRSSSSSSGKIGRFSIEKEHTTDMVHPHETSVQECRKKGRFELTGAPLPSERFESFAPTQQPGMQHHVETLLKQLEIQKTILFDILHTIPNRSRSPSIDIRKLSNSSLDNNAESYFQHKPIAARPPVQTYIHTTIDHLQQVLTNAHQEKERLLKENEALKMEIERMKRQPTSILKTSNTTSSSRTPSVSFVVLKDTQT